MFIVVSVSIWGFVKMRAICKITTDIPRSTFCYYTLRHSETYAVTIRRAAAFVTSALSSRKSFPLNRIGAQRSRILL